MGLGGIVSKRTDARYRSGPSNAWLKSKNPESDGAPRARGGVALGCVPMKPYSAARSGGSDGRYAPHRERRRQLRRLQSSQTISPHRHRNRRAVLPLRESSISMKR
jgi:hypothetical protein